MHAVNSPDVGEAQLGDHLKQKYIPSELSDILTVASFVYTQFRVFHVRGVSQKKE